MTEEMALESVSAGRNVDEAWACLVDLHGPRLRRYLYHLSGDPDDTDEVYQCTFISAFKHIRTFHPELAAFSSWLCEIGRNLWIDLVRRRYRERECVDSMARTGPDSARGPSEMLMEQARQETVWRLVSHLSFLERVVVLLHYLEHRTYAEIGRGLGIPERSVKACGIRAKHMLRLLGRLVAA
jgi:RNA polymerase sigma-70 factor, ECF subfamily